MAVTEDQRLGHPLGAAMSAQPGSAREAVNQMLEAGLLDDVMDRVDVGRLTLTGEGGFLPEMIKAVLERGLATELTEHLGYERGDPGGRGSPNSQRHQSQDAGHRSRRRATRGAPRPRGQLRAAAGPKGRPPRR